MAKAKTDAPRRKGKAPAALRATDPDNAPRAAVPARVPAAPKSPSAPADVLRADAAVDPADRVITAAKLELLAAAGCKPHEAGSWFGLSAKDFRARLREMDLTAFWTRAGARGRVHIRLSQFRLVGTSPSMALHLGKILLGQKGADDAEGGVTLIVDTGIRRGDAPQD